MMERQRATLLARYFIVGQTASHYSFGMSHSYDDSFALSALLVRTLRTFSSV